MLLVRFLGLHSILFFKGIIHSTRKMTQLYAKQSQNLWFFKDSAQMVTKATHRMTASAPVLWKSVQLDDVIHSLVWLQSRYRNACFFFSYMKMGLKVTLDAFRPPNWEIFVETMYECNCMLIEPSTSYEGWTNYTLKPTINSMW